MSQKITNHFNKTTRPINLPFLILLLIGLLGTTDLFAAGPQVTEVYPIDGAQNVPLDVTPRVTFNADMDKSSFEDPGAISLVGPNFSMVPIATSWDDNKTILLNPTEALSANTNYTVIIRGEGLDGTIVGVMDAQGNQLEATFQSDFETGASLSAIATIDRTAALSALQDPYIQFRPEGFTQDVTIPRDYVILPLTQFLIILRSLPPQFDLNELSPVGAFALSAAHEAPLHGGLWHQGAILSRDFDIQGRIFNMPFYNE